MSRIVVIEKNKNGKIELTKEELQKMLDDAYNQGYMDGKGRYETITYPSHPIWCTTANAASKDSITLTSVDVSTELEVMTNDET